MAPLPEQCQGDIGGHGLACSDKAHSLRWRYCHRPTLRCLEFWVFHFKFFAPNLTSFSNVAWQMDAATQVGCAVLRFQEPNLRGPAHLFARARVVRWSGVWSDMLRCRRWCCLINLFDA